jgi:hypothetical protein
MRALLRLFKLYEGSLKALKDASVMSSVARVHFLGALSEPS